VSLRELIGGLASILGRPELVEFGAIEAGPNEPPVLVADVSRLRDELGWRPAHDLLEGLQLTADWWRRHLVETGELHA
jgi:nucleoside-diphosphate-sugar epimerase